MKRRFISCVAIGSLFLSVAIKPRIAVCQSPAERLTKPALATEIESLLVTEYEADDDSAAAGRVQKLFNEYGIPAKEMVGTQGVEDFVVLLVNDQPLSFMKEAFPAVKAAAGTGQISSNNDLFFRARMKQKEVESRLGAPTNPELQKQIEALLQSDQAPRQKKDFDPKKMVQVDQQNRAELHSILERFGMPTFAMVGSKAATDFVILIQHQPADFRQQALPKLKQNVDAGQAAAKDYAMMYDRAQTDQGKPEIYGVNLICQANGTLNPGPITDPEHVEDRRAEIGLIPLTTYMRLVAVVAPPDFCKAVAGLAKK